MERFLVTGGAGFIGSNICKKLVSEGCFVRVVDNLLTGKKSNLKGIIDKIDLVYWDMREVLEEMRDIDVVLHLGALPFVPHSISYPATAYRHCAEATFRLLLTARDAKVKRFVFASSSAVYGDSPVMPKTEDMAPDPLSPYAAYKLAGEIYCSMFYKCYGLETISLRYFNVFGPNQDPTSDYTAAIPAFITAILKDKPPTIYGDGTQTRDFVYVDNIVEANLLAARMEHTAGEVVNIASGQSITINETIKAINHILGKDIPSIHIEARKGDVEQSSADISLAKKLLCYEPKLSFKQGLRETIRWYRET